MKTATGPAVQWRKEWGPFALSLTLTHLAHTHTHARHGPTAHGDGPCTGTGGREREREREREKERWGRSNYLVVVVGAKPIERHCARNIG